MSDEPPGKAVPAVSRPNESLVASLTVVDDFTRVARNRRSTFSLNRARIVRVSLDLLNCADPRQR
jgi:hypothetical protein